MRERQLEEWKIAVQGEGYGYEARFVWRQRVTSSS